MAQDSRGAKEHRPQLVVRGVDVTGENPHGKKPLENIHYENEDARWCSEDASDIRSTEVAGSMSAEIDAPRFSGEVGGWNRAGEVGDQKADNRRHLCGLRRLAAHDDPQRIAAEAPRFTKLVVQVTQIGRAHV